MGQIKAISWLETLKVLNEKHGPQAIEAIKALLTDADRIALYETPLMPVSWLDLGLIMRNGRAIDQTLGKGDWSYFKSLLEQVAERQFTGIYRLFLKLANPESILHKAPQIWRQYYNTGTLTVEITGPRAATLQMLNFPDLPLNHEHLLLPYLKKVMELAGAKQITTSHPLCLARKDPRCLTEIAWS